MYVALIMFNNVPLFTDWLRYPAGPLAPYYDLVLLILTSLLFLMSWKQLPEYLKSIHFKWALVLSIMYGLNYAHHYFIPLQVTQGELDISLNRFQRSILF